MRNIAAADVEQPRHRLRVGNHQRVGGGLFHRAAHARELLRRVLAGVAPIVQHDRAGRGRRPLAPDRIERVVFHRYEAGACRSAGFAEPLGAVDRMQPRRIAELRARRQVGFDPSGRRSFDQVLDDENRGVDLLAHLHLITAVDEDCGAIGEHDRRAGRAGEAGEPGEPLVRRRHVFALEAVGVRHDEAVEPAPSSIPRATRRRARRRRRGRSDPRTTGNALRTCAVIYGASRWRATPTRRARRASTSVVQPSSVRRRSSAKPR